MRVLVLDYPYAELREIGVEDYHGATGTSSIENFKMPILEKCAIAPQEDLANKAQVTVFLDIGTDITLVREELLDKIEPWGGGVCSDRPCPFGA